MQACYRFVNDVTRGLPFVYAYIDELLVASATPEKYRQHLCEHFRRLDAFGLVLNIKRCISRVSTIEFLRYTITSDGIQAFPFKVQAVRDFHKPLSLFKVPEFLRLVNFHGGFIPCCAKLHHPLTYLLYTTIGPSTQFLWTPVAATIFPSAKNALAYVAHLGHLFPNTPTLVMFGASDISIKSVFQQLISLQ